MDGCILTGFLLGLPANEIVVPIIIMTYMAGGSLIEIEGAQLLQLFTANGWTWITAVSTILFSLMHWPCATTLPHHQKGNRKPEMDPSFFFDTHCLRNSHLLFVYHCCPSAFS